MNNSKAQPCDGEDWSTRNVGHSFSQTVCGNFVDEFLNDFFGDFFFTHPRTRPESFVLGRIACKLENRS